MGTTSAARIAANIRRLLACKGLDQKAFAALAGLNPPNFSRLLSGKHAWRFDTLERVAATLGVDVGDLSRSLVPVYDSVAVACGQPDDVEPTSPDEWADIGSIFGDPADLFVVRAKGTSMLGAGIQPKDLLVVRRRCAANIGQKVLALVGGKATVKVFGRDGRRFCLKPCSEEHEVIYLEKKDDPQIQGVIVGVIHREK